MKTFWIRCTYPDGLFIDKEFSNEEQFWQYLDLDLPSNCTGWKRIYNENKTNSTGCGDNNE